MIIWHSKAMRDFFFFYCQSLNWNVENIFLYVNVDMVCAGFLSVTLHFTAFFREDEPLKMFQLRKDIIIFSHKSLTLWININASCPKLCVSIGCRSLYNLYMFNLQTMGIFFRLIGKCMAKANCWKYKLRRNESGLNPPVLCLPRTCLDYKWERMAF